jgi:type II secretory pathway pseudopilin PulG
MQINKGAMFGLDARIALAIFGALSVISGAALYSAIQQSKVISLLASIKEIEKAIESYYLDTGQLPGFSSNNPNNDLSIKALLEKPANITGWKGPYLNYPVQLSDYITGINGGAMALLYKQSNSGLSTCSNGDDCHIFIWNHVSDTSLRDKMEEYLDGSAPSGNIDTNGKYHFNGASTFYKTGIYYDSSKL